MVHLRNELHRRTGRAFVGYGHLAIAGCVLVLDNVCGIYTAYRLHLGSLVGVIAVTDAWSQEEIAGIDLNQILLSVGNHKV